MKFNAKKRYVLKITHARTMHDHVFFYETVLEEMQE